MFALVLMYALACEAWGGGDTSGFGPALIIPPPPTPCLSLKFAVFSSSVVAAHFHGDTTYSAGTHNGICMDTQWNFHGRITFSFLGKKIHLIFFDATF